MLLVGPGAVRLCGGVFVARMVRARVVGPVGGAGRSGGGGEGVLAVCRIAALVGTVARVVGGGRCARGTRDGAVPCGAPPGVGGLWRTAALGRGGDGRCKSCWSIGDWGGGGGVVMVLVAPCSLALREWWSLYGVDVCGH